MQGRRHLVFVYGTLKEGCHNNYLLEGSTKVGPAQTCRPYHVTCVGFPIAYRGGPAMKPVLGELWLTDSQTLAQMDRLEGVPRHYQRTSTKVALVPGYVLNAWMYTQPPGRWHGRPCPTTGNAYDWRYAR